MVLLMVLKVGFALIICQALQAYIMDEEADLVEEGLFFFFKQRGLGFRV